MDSKEGISLKIHSTPYYQGVGIKYWFACTHMEWGKGSDHRKWRANWSQYRVPLIGIARQHDSADTTPIPMAFLNVRLWNVLTVSSWLFSQRSNDKIHVAYSFASLLVSVKSNCHAVLCFSLSQYFFKPLFILYDLVFTSCCLFIVTNKNKYSKINMNCLKKTISLYPGV